MTDKHNGGDDHTPIHGSSRHDAPHTSKEAGRSIDVSDIMWKIYELIKSYGKKGCISEDVENAFPDLQQRTITPRFSYLERAGMIMRDGSTYQSRKSGRSQLVMVALEPPFQKPAKRLTLKDRKIQDLQEENMRLRVHINQLTGKGK